MKTSIKVLILVGFITIQFPANAQQKADWPVKSDYVTGYVSALLTGVNPIIVSFEKLFHFERFHIGYTVGLTTVFYESFEYASMGSHAAFTILSGKKNHHFESKLGLAITPILLYSKYEWTDYHFPVNPVVTLGYRFQKPNGNRFFRVGISTAGLGFGMGWRI